MRQTAMIKQLVRWSITLGIAGAGFLGWGMIENLMAIALPQEEIMEKLQEVPVFMLMDDQGSPLIASGEGDSKLAAVYINKDRAMEDIELLKTKDPELAEKVQIVPLPLSKVYEFSESAQVKENAVNIAYIPDEEAVNTAKTILSETEQGPYQGGVPLFFATGKDGNGYISVEQDSQQVVPFFFDKAQLDNFVAEAKEQPESAEILEDLNVRVVLLENIIQGLKTSEDESLENMVLVPSAESLKAVQTLQQQQGLPAGEAAPAEAPAAAPAE